ncbi:MAG: hypothetical protein P8J01_07855, partial [Acidimicrobiales bacterium]|nr:hypothetical protein [Acidimicrobiales bacterium]
DDESDTPVIVEDAPVIVEEDSDKDVDEAVQLVQIPQESSVWENTANDNSLDTEDTDEAASSEGKETQGSSGLSFLWIILIIVAGLTTVGTATRKLQKNNS